MLFDSNPKSKIWTSIQIFFTFYSSIAKLHVVNFFREQEDPMVNQGNQGPQAYRSVDFHFKAPVKSQQW